MKLDKINYQDLIDMGFKRHEMQDDVLFRITGYSGFSLLEMEFDNLDIGISSGCFVSNEKHEWQFVLYRIGSGDTIRKVELGELKTLIEHLQCKSEDMQVIIDDIKKL